MAVIETAAGCRIAREGIAAQLRNPAYAFAQKVRAINYGSCYYFEPMTVEDLDRVDPEVACAHFNQSFCNPAEFHLVLTGNIEVGFGPPVDSHLCVRDNSSSSPALASAC